MVALNYARDVRIGDRPARAVALGSNFVWSTLEYLIRTLYGNGEQGAMYIPEPKVLGQQVLYQDAAGTVPVVSDGDPVGLMLDCRFGLARGPEMFTGQVPTVQNSGSSATYDPVTRTISSAVVGGSTSFPRTRFDLGLEVGRTYEIDLRLSGDLGSVTTVRSGFSLSLPFSGGVTKAVFVAVDPRVIIYQSSEQPFSVTIDEFSVRELPGNHATQSTSAARPVNSDTPPLQVYDNVDDAMNVTLPAIAAATVATATPTGADIRYPVDLSSGSYTITESHSGIIIREGELTAAEQQQVTDYLNAQAGV